MNVDVAADPYASGGLSSGEARRRLAEYGPNRAKKFREVTFLAIAREEILEPMILLLLAVGVLYTIWGEFEDALALYAIIATLIVVEIWNEYRAKKAIAALSKLAAPTAKVIRDGTVIEVPAEEVVPGDHLVLVPGTRVAADGRILTGTSPQIDESSLTGESFPVEKTTGSEVFAGTLVVAGEGTAETIATGQETRLGRIAATAAEIKPPRTPLQLAMRSLAKTLVYVALFFSIAIPVIGILQGQDPEAMILTGLALAFATIPEELPIIITMNLGLGSYQLSKAKMLIKKLKAAETLGNTTVILTDKTGTITESRMQVADIFPSDRRTEVLAAAVAGMTPLSLSITDRAILEAATSAGIPQSAEPILRERTFGDGQKTRAVVRRSGEGGILTLTGAPEEVIARAAAPGDIGLVLEAEASRGRRAIAVAHRRLDADELALTFPALEQDLEMDGLIAIEDPPRAGVRETIEETRRAGIRTIMVTGDHPLTAASIGKSVAIPVGTLHSGVDFDGRTDAELRSLAREVSIVARATPEHKYRLVQALQANGEVVAVTGDGVNDALALRGADIGIAMGIKGTDAAKEAADVVLADDNFVTVGRSIFEGRKIFDNLRKGVRYYLSAKLALIMVFSASLLLSLPFPFSPIQIILLELFMDLGASASFVAEPREPSVFRRAPRSPKEPFLDRPMLYGIAAGSLALFASVFVPYLFMLVTHQSVYAQTAAFAAWMIGHILLAFVLRSEHDPLVRIGLFSNRVMILWAAGALSLLAAAVMVPALGTRIGLVPVPASVWGIAAGVSIVCTGWIEAAKWLRGIGGTGKSTT